jgi:hypothetical protein
MQSTAIAVDRRSSHRRQGEAGGIERGAKEINHDAEFGKPSGASVVARCWAEELTWH